VRSVAVVVPLLIGCSSSGGGSVHGAVFEGGTGDAPALVPDGGEAPLDAPASNDAANGVTLFDGVLSPAWKMSTIKNQPGRDDPGRFQVENGALVAYPGTDLGLFWYSLPAPADYVLELEWRVSAADDNSGVFVRFPDIDSKGYDNTAWVAVKFGFEIQIDERGMPDGAPDHTTGAIYDEPNQAFTRVPANAPGTWNSYQIRVEGSAYTVFLNGRQVTHFVNTESGRGAPTPAYVGLQTHTGHVAFRNIRLRPL
jgi:hypothetical protein